MRKRGGEEDRLDEECKRIAYDISRLLSQTMYWNVLKAVRQPLTHNISMQEPHNLDDIS